jgi:hypothetical protein
VGHSLLYHKEAFAFATADLVMPKGVDFAAREVMDGISMRIVRQYDINSDKFPCRLDVLYGYKTHPPAAGLPPPQQLVQRTSTVLAAALHGLHRDGCARHRPDAR